MTAKPTRKVPHGDALRASAPRLKPTSLFMPTPVKSQLANRVFAIVRLQ